MPTAISYTQIGGFGLALSQIGGLSTLLFLSANKIIFRRWREEWQSTASRTGIIRVPSTVFSPDTSTYDKVTGTRTLQRKGVNPPLCPAYFVRPRRDSRGAGNRSAKAAG